jgi:hypothetical protein
LRMCTCSLSLSLSLSLSPTNKQTHTHFGYTCEILILNFSLIYLSFYTSQFLKNLTIPHQTIHSSTQLKIWLCYLCTSKSNCHNYLIWKTRLMTFSQIGELKNLLTRFWRIHSGEIEHVGSSSNASECTQEYSDYPEYSCGSL